MLLAFLYTLDEASDDGVPEFVLRFGASCGEAASGRVASWEFGLKPPALFDEFGGASSDEEITAPVMVAIRDERCGAPNIGRGALESNDAADGIALPALPADLGIDDTDL